MIKVYYDTKCNFCSNYIDKLKIKSIGKSISYYDLANFKQDEKDRLYNSEHSSVDSLIVQIGTKSFYYTGAIIILFHELGGIYLFYSYCLRLIPKWIRDRVYKFIAHNRYRISGHSHCSIP